MQEKSQNWGALELSSLRMVGVADPKVHGPPARVTTSKLVVLHQRVCVLVEGNPSNWGALEHHPLR